MRYFLVSVLLLAASLFGLSSEELSEMSEAELLTELMQILEQQEAKLTEQAQQIETLETHLTEARRQLTIAKVWQEALTARINKLQTLHTELKTSWQNYRDEKEREVRRLKFALVGVGAVGAGLGGLNIWQLTKK